MKKILFIVSFFFLLVNTTYSADFLLTGSTIQESGGKLVLPTSASGVHINNDAFLSNSGANMTISGNFWLSDTSSTVDETLGWATFDIGTVVGAPKVVLKNNLLNGSSERIFTFSGFAWSHAAGWIYFSPILLKDGLGVDISNSKLDFNMHTGLVSGCAWSQNLGWICLETTLIMDTTPPDLDNILSDGTSILKPIAASDNITFNLNETLHIIIEEFNSTATQDLGFVSHFSHDMHVAKMYYIEASDSYGNTSTGYIQVVANVPYNSIIPANHSSIEDYNGSSLSMDKIADGNDMHTIHIELKDIYGNPVIPVAGIKNVEVTLGLNNNLDKDQIENLNILGDAIDFGNNNFVGLLYGAGNSEGTSYGTINGFYDLEIKSYAPSSSGYTDTTPNNNIGVSKYVISVTATGGYTGVGEQLPSDNTKDLASTYYSGNFKFTPALKITSITNSDNWDITRDNETSFTGTLNLTKTVGSSAISSIKLTHILDVMTGANYKNDMINYQNIAGTSLSCIGFYTSTGYFDSPSGNCNKLYPYSSNLIKSYAGPYNSSTVIYDNFKATPRLVNTGGLSKFDTKYSSEISYSINGNLISYPSKSSLISSNLTNNEIKIAGLVNKNNNNFSVIQDSSIVSIGKISKLDVYNLIHKNAFEYARNGTGTYETKYTKGDYSIDSWPTGIETIIVDGGDITIGTGITKLLSKVKVLIALKDKNGKGGNIFIKNNVQKIYSTLIADKSVISGNGAGTYYTDTNSAIDQLYIKGTVLSYNTIGGASKNPVSCPFYIDKLSCDLQTAKRYDFNHFRNYKKGVAGNDSVSTLGITMFPGYDVAPMIIEYDSDIQLNIPKILKSK